MRKSCINGQVVYPNFLSFAAPLLDEPHLLSLDAFLS